MSLKRTLIVMTMFLFVPACKPATPELRITAAWSRPTAPGEYGQEEPIVPQEGNGGGHGVGVVYLHLANAGDAPDRLLSVRSSVCKAAELHRSFVTDGRMRMVPMRDGIEIPAGETVQLAPGGLHIMLFGLKHDLLRGERVDLKLSFERSGEFSVQSQVRQPWERGL